MEFLAGHCLLFLHSEYPIHKIDEGKPNDFDTAAVGTGSAIYLSIYPSVNLTLKTPYSIAMTFNVATNPSSNIRSEQVKPPKMEGEHVAPLRYFRYLLQVLIVKHKAPMRIEFPSPGNK